MFKAELACAWQCRGGNVRPAERRGRPVGAPAAAGRAGAADANTAPELAHHTGIIWVCARPRPGHSHVRARRSQLTRMTRHREGLVVCVAAGLKRGPSARSRLSSLMSTQVLHRVLPCIQPAVTCVVPLCKADGQQSFCCFMSLLATIVRVLFRYLERPVVLDVSANAGNADGKH